MQHHDADTLQCQFDLHFKFHAFLLCPSQNNVTSRSPDGSIKRVCLSKKMVMYQDWHQIRQFYY